MIVTIFTDISMHQSGAFAAWAMWAISDRGKLEHAAVFKGDIYKSTTLAEAYAMLNGVSAVRAKGVAQPGDRLLLASDSTQAYRLLSGLHPTPKKNPALAEAMAAVPKHFEAVTAGHLYEFRYVKGHSRADGVRSNRNNQVDELARRTMREEAVRRFGAIKAPQIGKGLA